MNTIIKKNQIAQHFRGSGRFAENGDVKNKYFIVCNLHMHNMQIGIHFFAAKMSQITRFIEYYGT